MNIEKLDILQEIYDICLQDKNDENEKLQKNLNSIDEINAYLNAVKNDSNLDYKIFSPRKEEDFFKKRIEIYEEEKLALEKNNQTITTNINKFDKQLEKLKQLMCESGSDDLKQKSELLKNFDVLDIQEKERQRIASELHDSSVQNLTHLVHMIEISSMYIDQDVIKAKLELETCIQLLRSTINEIRNIIFNLRPMTFDDLGFKQSIENLITNTKYEFKNFEIEYHICELNKQNLGEVDEEKYSLLLLAIYRVIQESVTNALKHSNGNKIILNVTTDNKKCFINIKDDGKGFSFENLNKKKEKHFGITLMKEKIELLNGNISINTEVEKGTEIEIEIPLI